MPEGVRESLNVESGLNDGICVPVILFFLALAGGSIDAAQPSGLGIKLIFQVIGIGAVVGLILAVAGGASLKICARRGWVADTWLQIPIIALALLCFSSAQWLGGSGFIASFVGGLVFGGMTKEHKGEFLVAAEGTADALALVTWFSFGTIMLRVLEQPSWQVVTYGILSLTVVRMLPVGLSLIGKGLRSDTVLFIGWFGPRGLASIVFAVIVLGDHLPGAATILATVSWTILLSVVAHGLTANWLASLYGARVERGGGAI